MKTIFLKTEQVIDFLGLSIVEIDKDDEIYEHLERQCNDYINNEVEETSLYLFNKKDKVIVVALDNKMSEMCCTTHKINCEKPYIEHLSSYDFDYLVYVDENEFLQSFGLAIELDEATKDCKNCMIWVEYFYSDSVSNTLSNGYVKNDDFELLTFDGLKAAEEWIDTADNEHYYLRYGEQARPHYIICNT